MTITRTQTESVARSGQCIIYCLLNKTVLTPHMAGKQSFNKTVEFRIGAYVSSICNSPVCEKMASLNAQIPIECSDARSEPKLSRISLAFNFDYN